MELLFAINKRNVELMFVMENSSSVVFASDLTKKLEKYTKEDTLIKTMHVDEYKYTNDENKKNYLVIRLKEGIPDKFIRLEEKRYPADILRDILNEENEDKSRTYYVFEVSGKIEWQPPHSR